jgi:hypothetical protein
MRRSNASFLLPFLALLGLATSCSSSSEQSSTKDAAAPDAGTSEAATDAASDADGAAGPVITPIAQGQNSPYRVAVGGGHVYWTDQQGGTVSGAPVDAVAKTVDGGETTILVSGLTGQLGGIAVDSNNVYFTDTVGCDPTSVVLSVPLSGGTPTTLAGDQLNPTSITVDSKNVYWTSYGSGANGLVESVPVGGGTATTIASAQVFPGDIAVDDTNVYWSVAGANPLLGAILKAPIGGGTAVTLASNQDAPAGLAVTGGNVYWGSAGGGYIASAPVGGGSTTTVVAMAAPVELAADSTAIYWTDEGMTTGTDAVNALPLSGDMVVQLAGQRDGVAGIAVDATSVYWAETGGGAGNGNIMRVTPK